MVFFTRMGFFVWLMLLLISCSDDTSTNDGIQAGEVELRSGVPQRVSSNMILELIEVNDSRCPVGVVCSSAGEVDITFMVYLTERSFEKSITYSPFETSSCDTIEAIVVYINDVLPYKFANDELKFEDYRITVEIENFL
ncbi:MAG: hypothetical protein PF436_08635 [Prolixibacteraceae bacterium]|jgi:hypothetical protein|nr:hypothetical protein [Prolixibacteraceae bacterium]